MKSEIVKTFENVWFDKGMEYYNSGYYKKALECFSKVLYVNPKNAEATNKFNEIKKIIEICPEIENLNLSNYKEIYNLYKSIFMNNKIALRAYLIKLKNLIKESQYNRNYGLFDELSSFLLEISNSLDDNIYIWKFKAKGRIYFTILHNDKLFLKIRGNNKLYAINSNTGEVIWKFEAEKEINKFTVYNDTVFICSSNVVYAINSNTGKIIWTFEAKKEINNLNAYNDTLFIISSNVLYVINSNTREVIYTFETEESIVEIVNYNNLLCILYKDGLIFVYDNSKNDIIWSSRITEIEDIDFESGYVFERNYEPNTIKMSIYPSINSMCAYDKILFVLLEHENYEMCLEHGHCYVERLDECIPGIFALDIYNGELVWEYKEPIFTFMVHRGILFGYTRVCDSYDSLYAIDAYTGKVLWKFNERDIHAITIYDDILYVGCNGGYIRALNTQTGNIIRTFKIDNISIKKLIIYNNILYVIGNELIYAIDFISASIYEIIEDILKIFK